MLPVLLCSGLSQTNTACKCYISIFTHFSSFWIPKYNPYAMMHKMIMEEMTISSLNTWVP